MEREVKMSLSAPNARAGARLKKWFNSVLECTLKPLKDAGIVKAEDK